MPLGLLGGKQDARSDNEEMKAADAAEGARHGKDHRGDEMPTESFSKSERLERLQEAKECLELTLSITCFMTNVSSCKGVKDIQ